MNRDKSIGIDVSKERLDVCFIGVKNPKSFANEGKGISRLLKEIEKYSPDLVTIEATGKLHRKAARCIDEAGYPVLVAQPKRVRDFSKGLGLLAKTDAIDAKCIAIYGQKSELPASKLLSQEQEALKDLVSRRQELVRLIASEKNRLSSASECIKASCETIIKAYKAEVHRMEAVIKEHLARCEGAKEKLEILSSAKGVGEIVGTVLVSHLPELGTLSKRQIASLCGVAPFNRDSGKMTGRRSIFGGRATVRCALYMAALSAIRFDPILSKKYITLVSRGKNKRLALTAIMRMLVVKLNAMLRDGVPCRHAA